MVLFLLLALGTVVWVSANRPTILVLHSYYTDYAWTRDINAGIHRVVDRQNWVNVRYHYMDTKRRNDEEHLRRAGIAARHRIEQMQPGVVIAVDDLAQLLVGAYFLDHPHIRIVFAGVNGGVEPYGYPDADNVTGIYERKPYAALKEIVTLLSQAAGRDPTAGPVRVALLADQTLSATRDIQVLEDFDWRPLRYVGARRAENFDDWKTMVLAIGQEADYVLTGDYRVLRRHADSPDRDPKVPADEVARWTEANAPVPVIGINPFNSEDGIMISVGASPYEQGRVPAEMALRIIEDKVAPSDIRYAEGRQYIVAMRRSALERRNIVIPTIFEAFARATDNFYP